MEDYRDFYRQLGITDAQSLQTLSDHTTLVHHKKGEYIIRAGDPMEYVFFHLNGITKGLVLDENGEEQVIGFSKEVGDACIGAGGIGELIQNDVQCLTEVDSLRLSVTALAEVIQNDRTVAAIYENLMRVDYDLRFNMQVVLAKMSGEEKYEWFLENYPYLSDRVPQKDVASFLGMLPQTLSRIKSIKEKGSE